ncbi:hypothetical protein ACS0TY_033037 [Phlomoides rotata]
MMSRLWQEYNLYHVHYSRKKMIAKKQVKGTRSFISSLDRSQRLKTYLSISRKI